MDAIAFDQLPYLCTKRIFRFLNLRDIARCRAVSRQFKLFADQATVDELVVTHYDSCRCSNWCLTETPINFENSTRWRALDKLKSLHLDQKLKFLHVHLDNSYSYFSPDIEFLNGFKQLIHLEIIIYYQAKRSYTLTLPNLKLLYICPDYDVDYVLKTPKLEVLVCDNAWTVSIEYPARLRRLECVSLPFPGEMAKLKNLEILVWRSNGRTTDRLAISHLGGRLQELHLEYRANDEEDYEQFGNWLVDLMNQKAASGRNELKLYLHDVLLVDTKQVADYVHEPGGHDGPRGFWFKYYKLLRLPSYPSVTQANFDWLMELGVELPSSDFFGRFPSIETVGSANEVAEAKVEQLEWFLRNATALRRLFFRNTSLDQAFMNRLPSINGKVVDLKISGTSNLITNFDFILQLERLKKFEVERQLGLDGLDLVAKAFRQLNELESFRFKTGKNWLTIDRPVQTDLLSTE